MRSEFLAPFGTVILLAAVLLHPLEGHAQGKEEYTYRYARPGQATQEVYIWGAVDQPGIWEVAPETDLVELFSVARPTGFGTEEIGTETQVMVRIRRTENGQTQVAHEMQLKTLLNQAPNQRPSLQAGDVIEVRTVESRKLSIRTVGTIVGTLSSVTILILRLARVGG